MKFPICVTSYSSRKKFLLSLALPNQQQLIESQDKYIQIKDQNECIHQKFKNYKKQLQNLKRQDDPYDGAHCSSILDFIRTFCAFPEIQEIIQNNEDKCKAHIAFSLHLETIKALLQREVLSYYQVKEEDYEWVNMEFEKYVTRLFYEELFPKKPLQKDLALQKRLKALEWISFEHLEIPEKFQLTNLLEDAKNLLLSMDDESSSLDKLQCIIQCFKVIQNIADLSSSSIDASGADDSLPFLIFTILQAVPPRMYSNIHFINLFRNKKKMLSQDGYCFIHLQSALAFLEKLTHQEIKMNQKDFELKIFEKEVESQIHFLKRRPRSFRAHISTNVKIWTT